MLIKYETIYKFDTKSKLRIWYMEQEDSRYRTISGLIDGKQVTTEWTQCIAKNVGMSNEKTPEEQAKAEILATYEHRLKREYHKTAEEAKSGAHYFMPMLAEKYDSKKFSPGFVQPKIDGIRCIATKEGLFSRQGIEILGAPHIFEALIPLFDEYPDTILDGELYNHDLHDDFNAIASLVTKKKNISDEDLELSKAIIQYHVYDLPSQANSTFGLRSAQLKKIVAFYDNQGIKFLRTEPVYTTKEYDALHSLFLDEKYEGSIYRKEALYENKRTYSLQKRKETFDAEFQISKIIEGIGNWSGYAKSVEFIMPGDIRTESGERPRCGIKGNQAFCKDLLKNADKYSQVTVKWFNMTPAGVPRFGVATKFHEGKQREF